MYNAQHTSSTPINGNQNGSLASLKAGHAGNGIHKTNVYLHQSVLCLNQMWIDTGSNPIHMDSPLATLVDEANFMKQISAMTMSNHTTSGLLTIMEHS
jgi:hypothetical protein